MAESIAADPATPRFVTNLPKLLTERNSSLGKARDALLKQVEGNADLTKYLRGFFEKTLAEAVQERETKYVNTMSDVFKQEMRERNEVVKRLTQKCSQLETRIEESDQTTSSLHSKLDRRVYEMDMLRKLHFKELLMLREMVSVNRNDPRTLKALNDAIATNRSNNDENGESRQSNRRGSVTTSTAEGRIEALKSDLEKRKKFADSLRDERDKWQQKTVEALEQVEALKDLLRKRENSPNTETISSSYLTSWWYGGPESGSKELQAIEMAVLNHHITYDEVSTAVIELLAAPDIWTALMNQVHQTPNAPAARSLAGFLNATSVILQRSPSRTSSIKSIEEEPEEKVNTDTTVPKGHVACSKCLGTGYLEPNATEQDEVNEKIKALQKNVEILRKDLRGSQSHVVELETTRDELENGKRALVAKVAELQSSITTMQEQAAADAAALEAAKLEVLRNRRHVGCQTDPIKPMMQRGRTKGRNIAHSKASIPVVESPTDAELGQLNRNGLEELVAEKCTLIGELQVTQYNQLEQIEQLEREMRTANENLVTFNRASENAQQLLRQEIIVLRDTISNLQDTSTSSMREKQATIQSILTRMKTEHMKPILVLDTATRDSPPEQLAEENKMHEQNLSQWISWSESDAQAEKLAHATAEAACRAEAELDDLPLAFVQEDNKEEAMQIQRLSVSINRPDVPKDLVETIATLVSDNEATRASTRKMQTVQLNRIVTLSAHLSKVSAEMLLVRKKSAAEIAFWKTECERLDREIQCLVTEFNVYKSNHMVEGENAVIRSLLTAEEEVLWRPDGSEATLFLTSMREACSAPPVDSMAAKFLLLGEVLHASSDQSARSFHALKSIYDAYFETNGSPRRGRKRKSKMIKHGKTTNNLSDASPSPPKSFESNSPKRYSTTMSTKTKRPSTSETTKRFSTTIPRASRESPTKEQEEDGFDPPTAAFPLTAVIEIPNIHHRPEVDNNKDVEPLSSMTAIRDYEDMMLTTVETPASAVLASAVDLEVDIPPPDQSKHNPHELSYLKTLANNRSDTLVSLPLVHWEMLILKLQLLGYHARSNEMRERRVRYNRPHVVMQSMSELVHYSTQRREQALAECEHRCELLRDRLKHVNLCILHTINHLFPDHRTNRQYRERVKSRLELLDMSLIDMNNLPPTQQIPTAHFPLNDVPEPKTDLSLLVSPFKRDKRFPNRTTKFRYDSQTHEYSFMHVTKLVYPKSAGPTKTPFQHKPSVTVNGIRTEDGKMILQPKEDFDQPRNKQHDVRPATIYPNRPRSTPSYLSRAASIRQSPRQQRHHEDDL